MRSILDTIEQPQDLKLLSSAQLTKLAEEIRQLLVCTLAKNGGHLAPNLGVVELTIALHRVFNSPVDKILWDVGHQAYIHKLLTGRVKNFDTIRTLDGISGFPKREESEHDVFGTGHSSTSISAAFGIALARDIVKDNYNVIAVIGDGSLTGGQAYEAINNAGHAGTNLTVILNDNDMSIAKNVGAISEVLAKMRSAPTYSRVKQDIERLLKRIPGIGESVAKTAEKLKDSLKYLLVPGMLFEELGFTYFGPIDGHNIELLIEVLQLSKNVTGPVLIHVLTCKGKGYRPAELYADKFHGVGPFCVENGEIIKGNGATTYTNIFGKAIIELARKDKRIAAITAAMPEGTGLKKFAAEFPERFFDVGIAEPHAITVAAGMATQGIKPVVAIYSTFLQRGYDQILHDVCLQKLPVIFAIDRAGIVGEDGPTHHGVFDYAFLRHIPNLVIMAPKDENELQHMLFTAANSELPVAIRYPRGSGLGVPLDSEPQEFIIGEAEQLAFGEDIAIMAAGAMVEPGLAAGKLIEAETIRTGVFNARFIKPLDYGLLDKLAKQVKLMVTVEDNILTGGFGSAVLEYLNSKNNQVRLLRLGLPDQFIEHGSRSILLKRYGLTAQGIADSIIKFIKNSCMMKCAKKD